MEKMIYIMNVEWSWIKQRPHFIAEGLSKHYDITIVYQYKYGRSGLQTRSNEGIKLIPLKTFPKVSGNEKTKIINDILMSHMVKRIINKSKPDVVFVTYPLHIDMIPGNYTGRVYYDCMDNHVAFLKNASYKNKIITKEKLLLERANKVFVSSIFLENILLSRNNNSGNKITLVRNAYDGKVIKVEEGQADNDVFKLAYIGTISSWFDWETVYEAIQKRGDIEIHLFGPIDQTEIPHSNQIVYHGVIEHDRLYDAIKDMDCLVMPFLLNEIIEAVDPVKVYEYINFYKNILMREYQEVERLRDYVYFYNNEREFLEAIDMMKHSHSIKYSTEARREFLLSNDWQNRINKILEVMNE